MPIDASEKNDFGDAIQALLDAPDNRSREARLRAVFVEKLDFKPAQGDLDIRGEKAPIDRLKRIADAEGVNVVWASLDTPKIRAGESRAISKAVAANLGDHLLVVSNDDASVWQFIYPSNPTAARPILRRIVIERDLPRRTVVEQLAKVFYEAQKIDVRHALEKAYDVEPVTKHFFETYDEVFRQVMLLVEGIADEEDRRLFCQTLFNRLMFIYFLQRKGWLKFEGEVDYLHALRRASRAARDESFYTARLQILFFDALNHPIGDMTEGTRFAVGDVPFLNGGLFEKGEIDEQCRDATVPDEAFDLILTDLFDRFNFTVSESTPYDIEVAVDPEMLGKVFEELVTGRQQLGSYYTPRPVVAFMCREALTRYLEVKVPTLDLAGIKRFVETHDVSGLDLTQAAAVSEALDEVTVCDPACGSGAYLLGMLHELVELQKALYSERLGRDPSRLYEMKLHIIERTLYGVDIDHFAVNIAMLRLWLSLIVEFEGETPPALPNLHFKIVCGDSLMAPNPRDRSDMFRGLAVNVIKETVDLKARFLRATGADKQALYLALESKRADLSAISKATVPEDSVDWLVEFPEVFADRGGFDVVIANPPYNVLNKFEAKRYSQDFSTLKADPMMAVAFGGVLNIFRLFVVRSLQLAAPGASIAIIIPMALMCDTTSAGTRRLLFNVSEVISFDAFPERDYVQRRLFEKVKMSTCILIARNDSSTKDFTVRIHADRDIEKWTSLSRVSKEILLEFDPERVPVPICDEAGILLLRALGNLPRLGSFAKCFTGEIDMTLDRNAIVQRQTDIPLVKGAQVQPYRLANVMSQGEFEFLDVSKLSGSKKGKCNGLQQTVRVVLQGVTGVNESRRLKAALLNPGRACANSVNYLLAESLPFPAEFLVAVLNSDVLNGVFKALSTNSNVNVVTKSIGCLWRFPMLAWWRPSWRPYRS